jgi:ATP-dependent DNA helicase RecQ
MRELQDAGMLVSSGGQYPMVTLTKRGEEAMKGRTDYELHWPQRIASGASEKLSQRKSKARPSALDELVPVDSAVYERLKKVRLELARENGNVPAYIIFPDETLRAFARLKPKSLEAGRKIRGVGEVKAQRYLPAFIEAIAATDD